MEWGLKDFRIISPHLFSAKANDKEYVFFVNIENHINYKLSKPNHDADFYVILIPNKNGDNLILLTRSDLMAHSECFLDFNWIASNLKKKLRIETDLLHVG